MSSNKPKTTQTTSQFLFNFLAGGLAGVTAKTLTAPIQRVKLLLQTSHQNQKLTTKYKGIIDCFQRCLKQQGFWSLWRGNGVNVVRYFPTQALNFAFKDYFSAKLKYFRQDTKGKLLMANILSGGLAGSCGNIFVYPLDYVRTRLGVDLGTDRREFTGMRDCLVKTVRNDGFLGLYRGFFIGVASLFLYRGLYFGTYDTGKQLLLKGYDSFWLSLVWAQFTVVFSQTVAYPGDTIKRKMMMQSLKKQKMYDGTWDCIRQVYRNEGLRGFWKGSYSNILRGLGSSLCLVFYDELQKLRKVNGKE